MMNKSTTEEIRERFDQEVDRFSNLQTGQVSTLDAELSLDMITSAASKIKPDATHVLDIGCGAGNYTLKMLTRMPDLECTLVDLSRPMLDKAKERVSGATNNKVNIIQGDIREIPLTASGFDIILAGAVLHHLREEEDWEFVFRKLYDCLRPGGCLMISDLVTQDLPVLNELIWDRYASYLEATGGTAYRQKVLAYIAKEDSPRSLNYQLELMKRTGFSHAEILHKNACFAAYCAVK